MAMEIQGQGEFNTMYLTLIKKNLHPKHMFKNLKNNVLKNTHTAHRSNKFKFSQSQIYE